MLWISDDNGPHSLTLAIFGMNCDAEQMQTAKFIAMRNILTICLFLGLITPSINAQPTSITFPDFNYQDIEGNTHHLQSYLDQGKTVVIDVFATWCSVCNASILGLEELYGTLGQGGDESLVVLSFERDANTSNEAAWAANNNVAVPIITGAEALIADVWNVNYQPRYFIICPDGSFEQAQVGGIYSNPQPLIDIADECETANALIEMGLQDNFSVIEISPEGRLDVRSEFERMPFQIMDVTGSKVKSGILNQGISSIDLSTMRSGMYFISLVHKGKQLTLRFIR